MNKFITYQLNGKKRINILYIIYFLLILFIDGLLLGKLTKLIIISKVIFILAFLALSITLLFLFVKLFKIDHSIHYLFLLIMIPIGLSFSLFMIPNKAPDEGAHMMRAYDVSNLHIITRTYDKNDKRPLMEVPSGLEKDILLNSYSSLGDSIKDGTKYDDKVYVSDDGISAYSYSFISYIHYSIAFKICELLNVDILIACYLARILGCLLMIFIIFNSIRMIPIGKMIVFLYAFNPIFLQSTCTITADCMVNLVSIFLISYILYLYFNKNNFNEKKLIILCILSVILSLLKYVYFPITLLSLLLLKKIDKKFDKYLFLIIIISIIVFASSYFLLSKMYAPVLSSISDKNINSMGQVKFILCNPFLYLKVLYNSIVLNGEFYIMTFLGRNLGLFTLNIPSIIAIIYMLFLIISPFVDNTKKEIDMKDKYKFIIVFILCFVLVLTGLYLIWTPVGYYIIEGVQGRYFVPIVLILLLTFINKNNHVVDNKYRLLSIIYIVLMNSYILYKMILLYNF